jgi:hypothetical protein
VLLHELGAAGGLGHVPVLGECAYSVKDQLRSYYAFAHTQAF